MSAFSFKFDISPIEREIKNMAGPNKEKYIRAVLTDAQVILLNYIKQFAPRKTGAYSRTWKKGQISGSTATVQTTAGKLYAILEFTGAKPQTRVRSPGQGPYVFQDSSVNTIFTMKIN